jgi:hypothetical protein
VEKPIAADGEVDKRGLDRGLEIDDLALVDVPGVALEARPFHVQLFENAVFHDGDPALLRLEDIDQHFFLHAGVFLTLSRLTLVGLRVL